jgi:hypothetical protein
MYHGPKLSRSCRLLLWLCGAALLGVFLAGSAGVDTTALVSWIYPPLALLTIWASIRPFGDELTSSDAWRMGLWILLFGLILWLVNGMYDLPFWGLELGRGWLPGLRLGQDGWLPVAMPLMWAALVVSGTMTCRRWIGGWSSSLCAGILCGAVFMAASPSALRLGWWSWQFKGLGTGPIAAVPPIAWVISISLGGLLLARELKGRHIDRAEPGLAFLAHAVLLIALGWVAG